MTAPALDALLFLQARGLPISAGRDDLAVATQLLGYHIARARRRGGGLVWYDTVARRTVSPSSPVPWNALPPLSLAFPVGIRVGGVDRDDLEALVHELDGLARAAAGPWALSTIGYDAGAGRATATVTGAAGPITMPGVARWRVEGPGGSVVLRATAPVVDGTVALDGITLPDGGVIVLDVDAPGRHLEYSGDGVQRLACGEVTTLRRRHNVERPRPTTTTSTAPTSTTPPTTTPPTTTSPPTSTAPTSTTPTTTTSPPTTTSAPASTTAPSSTTTSTTVAPTTPTTPAPPTTTIAPPTTDAPPPTAATTTSTTAPASQPKTSTPPDSSAVPSTSAPERPPELPRSGRAQGWQVVLASVLVGAGAALVALSRSGRSAGPAGPDPG